MTTFTYVPRPAEAWARRAGKKFNGEVSPTAVQKFLQPVPDAVTVAVAPVSPEFVETRRQYLRCATCGHMRVAHCTDYGRRKKWKGINWRGFVDDNGQIQTCQHVLPDVKPYACDSTACATRLGSGDDEHYCPCKKFVSPLAKKRVAKTHVAKAALSDITGHTLIPHEDLNTTRLTYLQEQESKLLAVATECDLTALPIKEIARLTGGMPCAWIRRTLKKVGIVLPVARVGKKVAGFVTWVNP